MICPHCAVAIHADLEDFPLFQSQKAGVNWGWEILAMECPNCYQVIIELGDGPAFCSNNSFDGVDGGSERSSTRMVWPITGRHRSVSDHVPKEIAQDFEEASALVTLSPKASAALSRRCLERMLHEAGGAKSIQLTVAIDEAISQAGFPALLGKELNVVKEVGNFAAHLRKDTNTGEIFDVEPEEAENTLDVLESLIDHYYVKPAVNQQKLSALNEKLARAGKKQID